MLAILDAEGLSSLSSLSAEPRELVARRMSPAEWGAVWSALSQIPEARSAMDALLDELGPDLALDPNEPAHIASRNAFRLREVALERRYGPIAATPGKGTTSAHSGPWRPFPTPRE
ncbi:MAG TPA: hypothetical protein VEY33_01455 [Gemmatimonadota bacterium]|nr:hypothetical protein [Gemmatimonadota bacterium]